MGNWGGKEPATGGKRHASGHRKRARFSNGYILVYIRESDLDWVLPKFAHPGTVLICATSCVHIYYLAHMIPW
jgi:hypothetical protein